MWLRTRFLAYGFLLGTAGIKALTSDEAKKIYTKIAAVGLRCADDVMKTAEEFNESCDDIVNDAKAINETVAKEKEEKIIADARALLEQHAE